MGGTEKGELARLRAEKIIRVQSGLLTATEAARQLGVSRKTYYKWEKRLLSPMVDMLSEREAGRPVKVTDPEKEALLKRALELEKEVLVLKQTLRIRELLGERSAAPRDKADRKAGQEHRKKPHSTERICPADSEKRGVSGQGPEQDRESSGKLEGVHCGEEGQEATVPGIAGSEEQTGEAHGDEYGLEKKRARQDV